jgi:glutamine amidotransferase
MQVLYSSSEEDDDPGLGLIPATVRRLDAGPGVKVPHMGWNEVRWTSDHPLTRGIPSGTRFYFVHSYAPDVIDGVTVGVTTHGREFTSAVVWGSAFATQFHPERSGEAGLALYEAFVKEVASA